MTTVPSPSRVRPSPTMRTPSPPPTTSPARSRTVPEDFRIALVLADVQDLPYEEIARVLDVPVGTVKSRVHRGRLALARAMGIGHTPGNRTTRP